LVVSHIVCNRCARNPALGDSYDSVNTRMQNLRFRSNLNHDKWDRAMREHRARHDAKGSDSNGFFANNVEVIAP
jgi:hypothetical protein